TTFAQASNATVAFDRAAAVNLATGQITKNLESFYVVYVDHRADNSAGAVVLRKFNFSGVGGGLPGEPADVTHVVNDPSGAGILYQWAGNSDADSDPALNPVVSADSNLPPIVKDPTSGKLVSFIDPATGATQTDPLIVPLLGALDPNIDNFDPMTARA